MAYKGLVAEIPIGLGGLNGSKNQAQIQPHQLVSTRNIDLSRGTISKAGGAAKYNTTVITGAPAVRAGFDWWPSAGVQRMVVVLGDGTIKKDSGAGDFATTLASALTVTDTTPLFVEGGKEVAANNRKLFIFTGQNQVKVLSGDGITAPNVATPPADWTTVFPTFGFVHEGRMWGGGNSNDPHRLYFTTTASHEDFTGAGSGSLSVFPGEGEKLIAAVSFKGLIVAWKFPVGIYLIDTSDPTVANWRVTRLTSGTGGVSPAGFCMIDNDIVFIDPNANFQLLSAVQEFGDAANQNLSQRDHISPFMRDNVNFGQLHRCRAIYYAEKREAIFTLTRGTGTVQDARMTLDFNQGDGPRFHFHDRDTNVSIWLRKNSSNIPRPMIGDDAGFVWEIDRSNKTKDGLAYSSEFQIANLDFSWLDPKLATKLKVGQFLELVTEPTGNWNVSVDIIWDGIVSQTVTFNMGSSGASLGSFVLGTDTLGGDSVQNRKRRIVGSGRRFSMVVRNSGAGEDFSLVRAYLHFIPGDERIR